MTAYIRRICSHLWRSTSTGVSSTPCTLNVSSEVSNASVSAVVGVSDPAGAAANGVAVFAGGTLDNGYVRVLAMIIR